MRILFAGATGVLGRATLPYLRRAEVVGLTRSQEGLHRIASLGVDGVVCDVYDYEALLRVAGEVRPEVVVNFVTDLSAGSAAANNRARLEGGANLLRAARTTNAARLVVESVAFDLEGEGGGAVEELERSTRTFSGDVLVLRFGRLWGTGTAHESPAQPPTIQIDEAGRLAARLILRGAPGTHTLVDPAG